MARIIIEVDTEKETFDRAMAELGFRRAPVPSDVVWAELKARADELAAGSKDAFDPNAHKAPAGSTDVVFTEHNHPAGSPLASLAEAMQDIADVGAITQEKANEFKGAGSASSSVAWTAPAENLPALGPMDGDRKRGEAAPGHRRRTNAQIAEDNAYLEQKARAEAALKEMDKGVHKDGLRYFYHPESESLWSEKPGVEVKERDGLVEEIDEATFLKIKARLAADASSISSGDERVNPEDEADEAAETAARAGDGPTLEDLRAAVARYIEKFGHAASVKNMQSIIGSKVADFEKASAEDTAAAIAKINFVIADGAVKTDAPAEPEKPVTASVSELVEAIKAYARKFDGTDDASENGKHMPITTEDLPKVFAATFGAKVTGMGSMPDKKPETLGKILSAIKAATDQNPFKREAKS